MNKSPDQQFSLNRCLVIIGMMGAGKSSVGRELARLLDAPFFDADREIEKAAGLSVKEIFAGYGEDEFRRMERDIIARLVSQGPCVLSVGGGAFMNAETRACLKSSGAFSIWLKVDEEILLDRVTRNDHRPLFQGTDPRRKLRELLAQRAPLYAEADLSVDCDDRPVVRTARQVMQALQAAPAFQTR